MHHVVGQERLGGRDPGAEQRWGGAGNQRVEQGMEARHSPRPRRRAGRA